MDPVRGVLKKFAVLFPVMVIGLGYLRLHYHDYAHASKQRLLILGLSFLFLYGWMLVEVILRKQRNMMDMGIQASFFVYFFAVLTLTGYFILFREVSFHHGWDHMVGRIQRRDRVNLELFRVFRIYRLSNIQIMGNLVLLFPLGIYLPLLYPRLAGFFGVILVAFLVSVTIETLQLVTSFRSTDVDDILLNTTGAFGGYICYRICLPLTRLMRQNFPQTSLPGRMA